MYRWYGMGGYWINEGLTEYIKIDRNTENVYEIQKFSDGYVGVILRLKLVNMEEEKKT